MKIVLAPLAGLLIIMVACTGTSPTTSSSAYGDVVFEDVKADIQGLFDAVSNAVQRGDASAYHSLLAAEIRKRCTIEQVQEEFKEGSITANKVKVSEVYLNVEDSTRALVKVTSLNEGQEDLEGLLGYSGTLPIPVTQEDGRWRRGFPLLPSVAGCPFDVYSGQGPHISTTPEFRPN